MRWDKKFVAALFACVVLAGGVVACGDDDSGGSGGANSSETGSTEGGKVIDVKSMDNASGDVTVCMGKDTSGDIKQAIKDFRAGKMGRLQ